MREALNLLTSVNTEYSVLSETDYLQRMADVVDPYLNTLRQTAEFKRKSGQKVYCEYYPLPDNAKGSVFISHGFTESAGKYHEAVYYYLQEGYSVCVIEHRGHGHSRCPEDSDYGNTPAYITDYQNYIRDMDHIVRKVLLSRLPGPYYLFAHSMGGAIGASYLEQHPDVFSKAVFTAPMFEINRHGFTQWQMDLLTNVACGIGMGHRFVPGQGTFSEVPDFANSAATCEPRFLYYFNKQVENPLYQNAGSSLRWAKECFKMDKKLLRPENLDLINIPVLLFQAEDDFFVSPGGQQQFMDSIKDGLFYHVPGTKHEIYMADDAVLSKYWSTIFTFLA